MNSPMMAVALTSSSQKLMQEIYDQFLICKICFETYNKPKTLSCLHIFCSDCLEKYMDAETERSYRYLLYSRTVTCPICRKKTELPSGGVRRLPDNFLVSNLIEIVSRRRNVGRIPRCQICQPVNYHGNGKEAVAKCLECSKLLCTSCIDLHKRTKVTRGHSLVDTQVEKSIGCKVHTDEVVRFYCEPCEMCVCILCTFQEHKGHDVQSFTDGLAKYQNSLDALVAACRERIASIGDHLELIRACEAEISRAEDQIRDTTIASIAAIRRGEKDLIEQLYSVYDEDTMRFLKEKHVLQDVLDNLTSSCSLTEVILKDRSIELLLLRREIQEKLELLLQAPFQTPPQNIHRQVAFCPGPMSFGKLVVVDGNHGSEDRRVVAFNGKGTETQSVGSSPCVYDEDDEKTSDRCVNTCPPDLQHSHTMTEKVRLEKTSVQTDATSVAEKGTVTQGVDFASQFTNTPRLELVDRSTLTTKTSLSDSHTETRGLIDYKSTICGPEHPTQFNAGTLTDPPEVRNKSTNTVARLQSDKKTSTAKLITHEQGTDTARVMMLDFATMAKLPGTDKSVATKTVVLTDTGTGDEDVRQRATESDHDAIWKGVQRVGHNLPNTNQETGASAATAAAVATEERGSSPCRFPEEIETFATKRKQSSLVSGSKRMCCCSSSETQTDMSLDPLDDIPVPVKRYGAQLASGSAVDPLKSRLPLQDRGTSMGSGVRVTSAGTGTVLVRITDPSSPVVNARGYHEGDSLANGLKCVKDKETSTLAPRMKDKATTTYVQSVEKATYMIQPLILSTGTNTPPMSTTEVLPTTDSTLGDARAAPALPTRAAGQGSSGVDDFVPALRKERRMPRRSDPDTHRNPLMTPTTENGRLRDLSDALDETQVAATSLETMETGTSPDAPNAAGANMATVTCILSTDAGLQKRPLGPGGPDSMKRIRTGEREEKESGPLDNKDHTFVTTAATAVVEPDRHDGPHNLMAMEIARPEPGPIMPYRSRTLDRHTSPIRTTVHHKQTAANISVPSAEKATATFQVQLKSTCVGTPIVTFRDRESSPIPRQVSTRSTSTPHLANEGVSPRRSTTVNKSTTTGYNVHTKATHVDPTSSSANQQAPLTAVNVEIKEAEKRTTVDRATGTAVIHLTETGTGMAHVNYFDKETCTARVNTMHKNVATENIATADKHTNTTDVSAAYRHLISPPGGSVFTVSRGTCTSQRVFTVNRETSPVKDLPYQQDRATSPVRKIFVNKAVGVTKADLMCPVDKFQRPGQGQRPRVLPKNMPKEEPEVKFVPLDTIQELSCSDDDDGGCSGGRHGCPKGRGFKAAGSGFRGQTSTHHREKLWVTAPRLGSQNPGVSRAATSSSGHTGSLPSDPDIGLNTCKQDKIGQSTFSANGSTQTSSILCKVETGTSTPPVETEDKAMCTESVSVDVKITECISKLRTVSQRLEAQATTTGPQSEVGHTVIAGPIYSKADSFRKDSVTTQATASPVPSGRVSSWRPPEGDRPPDSEGLSPLPSIPQKKGKRSGRLTGLDPACPPFLARRELHSIDTGMIGGQAAAGPSLAVPGSSNLSLLEGGGGRSKARKQRLDITQLLHRPPGAATGGAMANPAFEQRPGFRSSSLAGPGRLASIDDTAHRKLRAKMSALDSPEDEHGPRTPYAAEPPQTSLPSATDNSDTPTASAKQRSEKPKLERMLTPPSPSGQRKIDQRQVAKSQSPLTARRTAGDREDRGAGGGTPASPKTPAKGTPSPRSSKRSPREITRVRKASSGSSCSSSSSNDDGRDSPRGYRERARRWDRRDI